MSTGGPCTDCVRFAHSKTFFCLINHIFKLFDCLLKPTLTYGCEIYGARTYGCIESFHLKFRKHYLRCHIVSTNSAMKYAETGRYPFSVCTQINVC